MAHLTSNYPPTGTYPPPPALAPAPAPAPTGIYFPPPPPPAQTGTYPPPPPPLAQTGTYSPHPPPPAPTGIYSPPPPTPAPTGTYSPPPPPHAPTGIYSTPPPTPPLPVANSVTVIGPQFCEHTYPVDLAIVRKLLTITDGNFVVQDINGNTLLKVKGALLTVHNRRVLLDSAGKPIVTLRKKTKLDVFLASNTKEDVCDFKVKGSWSERSCVIHAGDSSAILAQMHMKDTAESILLGKDQFTVTVYPKIDYAFVISLIVILDAINSEGSAADVLSEF
ncbi:hypothetical protein Pint_34994 [Pistacia integerrima]|uniref:Uncharacterized protein n=1 Tax=Pistacia integerrima TaxID=434235 RepID=A0ACC0Y354_9ROSI|nr:hypothetical protein Pint_34994 [Pistacia integerrima]